MKNKFLTLLIVICSLIFVFGCSDPFELGDKIELANNNNGNTNSALVSICIGNTGARTIQPGTSAFAGYQLTFTGGTYEPVNLDNGANSVDVYLNNGTWTITAKAYKLGGTIGNNADVVASGSISVAISGGAVNGTVQPIILTPVGTGNGTLHYDITFGSGVTGYLTLWQINGNEKVSGFGSNGVLSLSSSVNGNFNLSAGRYIVEAKLTATDSKIAFRREVVEIWQETTSVFEFVPAVYLDPNAILPNSGAVLSETNSKFNNEAIGSGKGSGASEADPKTYTFNLSTPTNVTIKLEAETDSLFSTISWAANTGALPNGVYSNGTLPTNLSTNNVLWVKVVSEDGGTAMYYRFVNMVSVTYGNFTVLTVNSSGISWSSPNLTITQSGIYSITGTGTETTNRIQVTGSNITADITLKNVNINVSSTADAVAFNPNVNNGQGVTINLTLEGSNTFRSGANVPGLNISAGTIMTITDASTGTLTVYGRNGNTGVTDYPGGDGSSGSAGINIAGTMIINGGTVTTTGGNGGTGGIGVTGSSPTYMGYPGGSGGTGGTGINVSGIFTINGGTVTANGGNGGNGGNVQSTGTYRQTWGDYNARGGNGGTGISVSNITINGGTVTATGGNGGNGGIGNNNEKGFPANGGNGGSGISSIFSISGTYTANGGSGGTAWSATNNTAKGTNGSAGANVSAGNSNNISATLTANTWQNGNIITAGGDEWFMFTATASTQYIHVNVGTLTSLYVQVYDSNRTAVGSQAGSRSLTVGQEYYIRVWSSSGSGTYQIAFNAGAIPPGVTATTLTTANTWANGNIPSSSGDQWFKFTATASTQYIHVNFGTLTFLYVQVYNSNGAEVGSQTTIYSNTKYTSRSLTVGQEYYIRVWPYSSSYSGTYQIAFNDGAIPPGTTATTLTTANTWADGNIPSSSGDQWFKFTATASTQYIHFSFGTLTNLYVQVYSSNGGTVGSETNLYGSTKNISRSLTVGQEYYIRVRPYSSSYSGTYQIAFNAANTPPPITLPTNATTLTTANTWASGNITTAGGEQWFKFTATASTQYIHVSFGTLTDLNVQVYDSNGVEVGSQTNLYSSTKNISRPLTVGQEYYIKVWPFSSSGRGTYQIAFNGSSTAP
jgi:hypothetical protein